ncbi:MAG: hypothetical protein AUI14_23305 [Actinobacteria bacterium 13_2_20CM_2_71_6]|nr:MAG: hypothetical protein AUI14_23305 [Actinobacteria bacterium 13_2_20CM_2_71_6]
MLIVAGGVLAAGIGNGYPAEHQNLLSGTAWLPSGQVGQLTLLDGSSVEVAAQVRVAPSGTALDVVQQGANAYAVDRTAGSLRRVDGATFEVSPPATPVPGAGANLRAFAGPDTVYAMDTGRGVLTTNDPHTLATRTGPLSLTARVAPQAATLDEAGRLWLLDASTGDLVWIDHGQRHTRRGATQPGAGVLALADGNPVLVDTQRRIAAVLDPATAEPTHTVELDLRPDDQIQVTGSPHAQRLYVVAARGMLSICELTATTCRAAVPLVADNSEPGPAVEAGGRVFVPDYRSGQVWIVDLRQSRVVASPRVLSPPARFQLFVRDGVVFFNDPNSERAGVLRLDGGVRPVAKYDPKKPDKGLTTPGGKEAPTNLPPPPSGAPPPVKPPAPGPKPSGPGAPAPPPGLRVVVSTAHPLVGDQVTLSVTADRNPQPVRAHWTFGDGQEADGLPTSHRWTAPQTYQITVQATFPDGRTDVASLPLPVLPPPTGSFIVKVGGNGTVSSQPAGIACPPTCGADFPSGSTVQLTATPDVGMRFDHWGGGCSGTTATCQVTTGTGQVDVTADFIALPRPTLTVSVPTGGGTVTGPGIACPPTCSATFDAGQQVALTAVPVDKYTAFTGWNGGGCAGTGGCTVTLLTSTTVTAGYRDMADPEHCFTYDPNRLHFGPVGSDWELRSVNTLLATMDNIADVQDAQTVAGNYDTKCTIQSGYGIATYWKGGKNAPLGKINNETCAAYNPATLTVTEESPTKWHVGDGTVTFAGYFDSQAQAVRFYRVARQWHQECFIIGVRNFLGYWR